MSEKDKEDGPCHLPNGVTVDEMTGAYIEALIKGQELPQPVYYSTCLLHDGRWIKVSFRAEHEWLQEPPPEVMSYYHMQQAGEPQGGMH